MSCRDWSIASVGRSVAFPLLLPLHNLCPDGPLTLVFVSQRTSSCWTLKDRVPATACPAQQHTHAQPGLAMCENLPQCSADRKREHVNNKRHVPGSLIHVGIMHESELLEGRLFLPSYLFIYSLENL